MESLEKMIERFDKICYTLDENDILKINKEDPSAGVHNVISNINQHCFGVKILEGLDGQFEIEMFYITNKKSLKGDIILLPLKDRDYFDLLLYFCFLLTDWHEDIDAISAFNTFQTKLRSGLEKSGFFTTTSFELEQFKNQNAVMLSTAPKGIIKVDLINRTKYYRDFFNNNFKKQILENNEYVYLMLNDETGLVKIGYSKNPIYREQTLHSKEPCVFLIAFWNCEKCIERELHQKFRLKRVRGEWFKLNFRDLREIELLMHMYE